MQSLLGSDFFSLQGDWFCFSLNDFAGPFTFPRFVPPERPSVATELLIGSKQAWR